MCDPTGISESAVMMGVSMAMSAASTAVSYEQQSSMARLQKQQNAEITANAEQNLRNGYTQAQQNAYDQNTRASQKLQQEQLQTRAALATAQTSAGESGVAGNSMAEIANEYYGNQANYNAAVEFNRNAADQELMTQMTGLQSQAQSTINNERIPIPPSPFALGLSIGGDVLDSYNQFGPPGQQRRLATKTNGF